jgi:hypothetical protein
MSQKSVHELSTTHSPLPTSTPVLQCSRVRRSSCHSANAFDRFTGRNGIITPHDAKAAGAYTSLGNRIRNQVLVGSLVILVPIVALNLTHVAHSPEPVYAGKPLHRWSDDGYEPMSMALHELGPAAAPFILSKLRREDPDYGFWVMYHQIWRKTPGCVRNLLPIPRTSNFDRDRACSALVELGPGVIPQLRYAAEDHNRAVKIASTRALSCFSAGAGQNVR